MSNISNASQQYIKRVIDGDRAKDEKLVIVRKRDSQWDNPK
jgi:hypothetical protein